MKMETKTGGGLSGEKILLLLEACQVLHLRPRETQCIVGDIYALVSMPAPIKMPSETIRPDFNWPQTSIGIY